MIAQHKILEMIKNGMIVGSKCFNKPMYIETNSSLIVFTDNRAFKIIKEEKGEEYANLADRYSWVEEEVRINAEISPKVYFGVRPIFVNQNQIIVGHSLDASSNTLIIEYALCMQRLQQDSLVYNMMNNGVYTKEHSAMIARRIADFHLSKLNGNNSKEDKDLIEEFSSVDSLRKVVYEDFQRFEKMKECFIPRAVSTSRYCAIKQHLLRFLEQKRGLFKERMNTGYVLPIHGDFHSTNIFVERGSVYAIDRALRRKFRVNDILKDPAYLSVDLKASGLENEMQHFLRVYQQKVKDPYFQELLPFFMCRLALVRGIVNFSSSPPEQLKVYFDIAYEYTSE